MIKYMCYTIFKGLYQVNCLYNISMFLHIKGIFFILFLGMVLRGVAITPQYILPLETTKGSFTNYAFAFTNEVAIDQMAQIKLTFPFEFDPRVLTLYTGCRFKNSKSTILMSVPCSLENRTFTLSAGSLSSNENLIIVVNNIQNPTDAELSSNFLLETLFKNVIVDKNQQFGITLFTNAPINSVTTTVNSLQNLLINQGSSWEFEFTLTNTYEANSTLRFIFPEGFSSFKIQCRIQGVLNRQIKSRVFPQLNIFDCLNIDKVLTGTQKVILSGIVNPEYEITFNNLQIHILRPNNLVVLQKIIMSNTVTISHKNMTTVLDVPNKYRNTTTRYTFEINMDSDLEAGDYFEISLDGSWTFLTNQSTIIEGINSDVYHKAAFEAEYNHPTNSKVFIRNFSSVHRSSQIAFHLTVKTPLASGNYNLLLSAKKSHGGLVQRYESMIQINSTTGYIKEIRLHPMIQAKELPAGQTGPLEIILGLNNNLPKTNVLTYGRIYIEIFPKIPKPDESINGVPKCYWYGNIEAESCRYDDTTLADKSIIEAFTPIDYNFQSSQIPFMVTTEGYTSQQFQGITIDPLVKRYNFQIQFFSSEKPGAQPTQVIFSSWNPKPLQITTFSCETMITDYSFLDHLTCTFTTPTETLCEPNYEHIFRLQFIGNWDANLGYNGDHIYPNYPCIFYGDNLVADPYVKCDLVTWKTGAYKTESSTSYINIYGFEQLAGGSVINFQIPKIKRGSSSSAPKLKLVILQETWGQTEPYLKLYEKEITLNANTYADPSTLTYSAQSVSITLSQPTVNKVTDITLNSVNLVQSDVSYIIFEVDQTKFQDIGRQEVFTCGSHKCSKFNDPIQYFILHPQSALTATQTLVFPDITVPDHAGDYEFKLRVYKNNQLIKHIKFDITVEPEQLDAPTYELDTNLQTVTELFPNTKHYYAITFITKNPLPKQTSFIQIQIDNVFTLASKYCTITTTATAADQRGIQCEIWENEKKIIIENLDAVPASTSFSVTVQLISTTTAASVSPTVTITTYHSIGNKVDFYNNGPFNPASFTVNNLKTLTSFDIESPQIIERAPEKGYFGPLIFSFKLRRSNSVSSGYYFKITLNSDFYPQSDALNLPLSCKINDVRLKCSYSLAPFVVTINEITNKFSWSAENIVNITTEFQQHDGIQYPANQGKYLVKLQILNSGNSILEQVQQYFDIIPQNVPTFTALYSHLDKNQFNIFEFNFTNGPTVIPAFDDSTTAGRMYIGFPTKDDNSATVFANDLGFSRETGDKIPCWFRQGAGYIQPLSGRSLECRLIKSTGYPQYAFVQIINFDQVAASESLNVIMARIMNPASLQKDINFQLKITEMTFSTKEEIPLYISYYNMFFPMLNSNKVSTNEADTSTAMFDPTAEVGDSGKYMNVRPYTATNSNAFATGDWYILEMYSQFSLTDTPVTGCNTPYYDNCIVFPQVNWLMVKIGNTSIIDLQAYIDQMPTSISRVDKTFKAYTIKSSRFSEVLTYTITVARWEELMGTISNIEFSVLGSQDKININKKNVQVKVQFDIEHKINRQGTIEIRFPQDSDTVPSIKPHCRSAVALGSVLYGDPTGKPATNKQGEVGCLIQNSYSWIITSFDEIPSGTVIITGMIDLPNKAVTSLGSAQIITYGDTHSSDTRTHGRIIDYETTNFGLTLQKQTWLLDPQPTLYESLPLRVNHKGQLKVKIQLNTILKDEASGGYIELNLWRVPTMGTSTSGFSGPTSLSTLVCKIQQIESQQFYGCDVTSANQQSYLIRYRLQSFEDLPNNKEYLVTLTTETGTTINDGLNFPSVVGVYKIETLVKYQSSNSQLVSQVHFVEVYGSDFTQLSIISTVSIPDQLNLLLVEFKPSNTIEDDEQLVIEIPTVTIDGQNQFAEDLGMGYNDYDDLMFDLFESSITSATCKVYTGDTSNNKPVKIICSNFNTNILTSSTVKLGFWVKNPATIKALAIPIFVYSYKPVSATKQTWSIVQAAVIVIPTSQTPISDTGNFALATTQRQISSTHFDLTTRNARVLQENDLYILKFNFDLRQEQAKPDKLKYNSGFSDTGDVIFMRNINTVILRIGTADLETATSGQTNLNARIQSSFFTPQRQLTSSQSKISAYASYVAARECQKIIYTDTFPTLNPKELASPAIVLTQIHGQQNFHSREDYKISVKASTTDTDVDMALVKKISIQFPAFSDLDLKFIGTQCIQHISSTIQISDCIIDPTTRTIWMTVIQSNYANNNQLLIETKGLAIENPSSAIDTSTFVVRYYTWPDTLSFAPALTSNSDDYAILKQDSTKLPSTSVSVTGSVYNHHDKFQIEQEVYINDYLPPSSSVTSYATPFEFLFKAPGNFADLSGSTSSHKLSVNFNGVYTYASATSSNDLQLNVPLCELDGARIFECSISSSIIEMSFKKPLVSGEQYAIRFAILDPNNPENQGFKLISANNPTASLPILLTKSDNTRYNAEAQPFPTYHQLVSAYPQHGIYDVTEIHGTQVYDMINYIEFTITFTRSDIKGIVLEIPNKNEDGTVIYQDPQMVGLPSGSKYPCSVGLQLNVFCYYEQGSSTGYGKPTRIYITQFTLPGDKILSLRMLWKNPDIVGVYPSFIFKAYTGDAVLSDKYVGSFTLNDAFKTIPQTGHTSTASDCNIQPNKPLYNTDTKHKFQQTQTQNAGQYTLIKWPLTHSTHGQIAEYEYESSSFDIHDFFIIRYTDGSDHDRVLYLVNKIGSGGYSSGSYDVGHLRQKHFIDDDYTVYLLRKPDFVTLTCSVNMTFYKNTRMTNAYGTPSVERVDIQNRRASQTSWQYLQIEMGTPQTMAIQSTDPAEMILVVEYTSGRPFSSLSSNTKECTIQSGVTSTDKLTPVICQLDTSNKKIIISKFNKFTGGKLKLYYQATTGSSSFSNTNVRLTAYANQQAYSDGNWAIWQTTSTNNYNSIHKIYKYARSSVNNKRGSNGRSTDASTDENKSGYKTQLFYVPSTQASIRIIDVSSTSIKIRVTKTGSNRSFSKVYKAHFAFYVERMSFSGCSSVSVTSSDSSHSSFLSQDGCSQNGKRFWIKYRSFPTTHNSNNDHKWPNWNSGVYYDFTFNFASITGDIDPSAHQIYITGSMTYEKITEYYHRSSDCGCEYNCWSNDNYVCCRYNYCWRYFNNDYATIFFTGNTIQTYPDQSDAKSLANSGSIDLVSKQKNVETQLMLSLTNLAVNVGPSHNSFLLMKFDNSPSFPSNNPFQDTYSDDLDGAYIQCKCISGNPISITYSTSYSSDATCVRYVISNSYSEMAPSIGIWMNVNSGQDLQCYFPGFRTSNANSNLNVDVFRVSDLYFPKYGPIGNYWGQYAKFDLQQSYTTTGASTMTTPNQYGFWSSQKSFASQNGYQITLSGDYLSNPTVYMSTYAPKPISGFCSNSDFNYCRVYTSFLNRRYYVVAERSANDNSFSFSGNVVLPPACDKSSSYYNLYVGWGTQGSAERYYRIYDSTDQRSTSQFSPSTPTKSASRNIFGSLLKTYGSTLVFSIDLANQKLYDSHREQDQFQNSYLLIKVPSTTLLGCSVTLSSGAYMNFNPLSCKVVGSTTVQIRSYQDLAITAQMHVFIYAQSLPSSSAWSIQLFDKYKSTTDYSRSASVSSTISNNPSGNIIPVTDIKWRKQVYKKYSITEGPIRFTFANNYQYVYDVDTPADSDGFLIQYPAGGIDDVEYICYLKQYPPSKKYLYRSYQAQCSYHSTDKIRIEPPKTHQLSPNYEYQVSIYKHLNGQSGLITTNTNNYFIPTLTSVSDQSDTVINFDSLVTYKYLEQRAITLDNIYILTRQAGVLNSLYLKFSYKYVGVDYQYFEFEFDNLGLSSFSIDNGDKIPCYLKSDDFTAISGSLSKPECRGYAHNINQDKPLIIRVMNFDDSFSTNKQFQLSFDEFTNPAKQDYADTPVNLKVRYVDRTNGKIQTSYFPEIYVSDSFNIATPSSITGSLSSTNLGKGDSNPQTVTINWPFSSTTTQVSQKIAFKIEGGVLCCQDFENIQVSDNVNTSWTLLWRNTQTNISVYKVPSHSTSSRTLSFSSIVNPYAISKGYYESGTDFSLKFYKDYETKSIATFDQISFSSYTQDIDLNLENSGTPVNTQQSQNDQYHQGYPMIYDFTVSTTKSSYTSRKLNEMIIRFQSGISRIQEAYITTSYSTQIVNPVLQVQIYKESGTNYWCLKIPGLMNNAYHTSHNWKIRVRFYANANTIQYKATVYAQNGEVQFVDHLQSQTVSSDGYTSSGVTPSKFQLLEQRYVFGYYELMRKKLYPEASLTTKRLTFRFTPPIAIASEQQFKITLGTTTELIPSNSPTNIFCIFQPTNSAKTILSIGLYSRCNYNSGNYFVISPTDGLTINQQYTLSIFETNQLASQFTMPSSPIRFEIPFVHTSALSFSEGDTYILEFIGRMLTYSVNHLTRKAGQYNTIGFTFKPKFSLPAATSTTESVLQISLESRYFQSCLNVDNYYLDDGMFFESGTYFSHFSNPARNDANTRLLCGQYSESYSPIKLTVTDFGEMTLNTQYYFRFTLIKNPTSSGVPFIYKVRLLHYENSKHYPIIMGEYEFNNLLETTTGNLYTRTMSSTLSNNYVQKTATYSVTYSNTGSSTYDPPLNSQTHVKFQNDDIQALKDISPMATLSQTNYMTYEYYPNINLCIFKKTTSTTDRSINIGSYVMADDINTVTISWVQTYPNNYQIYRASFSGSTDKTDTSIAGVSGDFTTRTISKVTADLTTTNSIGIYLISFQSVMKFEEGGHIKITLNSDFQIVEDRCKELSGFSMGTNNQLICYKESATVFFIRGYSTIPANSALSVKLYLKLAVGSVTSYTSNSANILVYSSQGKKIIDGNTGNYPFTITHWGSYYIKMYDKMYQKIQKGTSQQFDFTFRLRANTLGTGDYFTVDFGDWTIDPAGSGETFWRYKVGSNINWVPPANVQNPSGNIYKIYVRDGFSISQSQTIAVKVYHHLPDSYNGMQFPTQQWNNLKIEAYNSADTLLEHQYQRVWIEPYQHHSLDVKPILKHVGAQTLYEFTFTPNVSASVGDVIVIEFATADGYQTSLFDDTLGFTIDTNSSLALSCHEIDHAHVISDDTQLGCELFKGSSVANPPLPTTIMIPIQKAISSGTAISFNILDIGNPASVANYPIQITAKLMNHCEDNDINNPCTYYRSTKYITFNSAPAPITDIDQGAFSTDNNLVSATGVVHTLSASFTSFTVSNGDYLKIKYYPEIPIPEVCTITSGNGVCYSYPKQNIIVIKSSANQVNSYSFSLGSMTNLYQKKGSTLIQTEIWDSSTGQISKKLQTDYQYTHITTDPTTSQPLSISFTPTLTPDYQLLNFDNIAKIQITNVLQNQHIKMIYLKAPSGIITLSQQYCNATLQSTTPEANPYPIRFQCDILDTETIKLVKFDDFPAFNPSTYISKKIIIYLNYKIRSSGDCPSAICPDWNVKAYTQDDIVTYTMNILNEKYLVSEGTGGFTLDPYQHPQINDINFYTQAFNKRTCKTNQKCMFYGYFLPSTSRSDYQIKTLTYTIPQEFGYSNSKQYDLCIMKQSNSGEDQQICSAERINSEVILTHKPYSGSYNHEYQLLYIDTQEQNDLFISPAYPGSHYRMKVNVFSTTDLLLQSMMVNLTSVYGTLLDYSKIQIDIPLDAEQYGLFKYKFEVGNEDVPPGYQSSSSNRIVSQIHLEFSKSFEDDLGTGKKTGQEIACVPISGMTFYSTGKLTCKIYPAYSTITYPRIQLTGYDKINKNSQVIFLIAGLKTLPETVTDYIKVGVSQTYYDYGGVKGYLYELTGFVVGPTTALVSPVKTITPLEVEESSDNTVGNLVEYTFTGTIETGFSPITVADYVSIQFQQNCFQGYFSQNSLAVSSLSTLSKTYSFGLSSIIYFQPTASISSASLSFVLKDMINSAFSMEYLQKTFKVTTYVNNKINAQGTATLNKFSKPSTNITVLISQLASIYGGDSGINYTMSFQLNSHVPEYGLITIEFPQLYESLYTLNSECILFEPLVSSSAYCEIVNERTVSIIPNGYLFEKTLTYSITLTNITNPNSASLDSQVFKITSYHNQDLYQGIIIAQSSFPPPDISIVTIKSCQTFEVILGAYNPEHMTSYDMKMICENMIKSASQLKIYLSWEPETTQQTACESQTNSLYSQQCKISEEYKDAKRYRFLQAYLREISPQNLISLTSRIKNPVKGSYELTAEISYKGFTYIRTTSKSFFINEESFEISTSSIFQIRNYPKNRDENAIFVFNLTTIPQTANIIEMLVPSEISINQQQNLKCIVFDHTFSQNYFTLLEAQYTTSYTEIPCQKKQNVVLFSNITSVIQQISQEDVLHVAIYSIINPSLSSIQSNFLLTFLKNQTSFPSAISSQQFKKSYQVSGTASNLLIYSFVSTSYKLYAQTEYIIGIEAMDSNGFAIGAQTPLGIIISLPKQYKAIWEEIAVPQEFSIKFDSSSPLLSENIKLPYGYILTRFDITSQLTFQKLQIRFSFRNPNVTIDCSLLPVFQISLYNFKTNSIVAQTLGNNVECPLFQDRLYSVAVVGNNNIDAGSASQFIIQIEKPASYLKIEPSSTLSAIQFEPKVIQFSNYNGTMAKFKIKTSDSINGKFNITFKKTEIDDKVYFQDIPDLTINVAAPVNNYQITFKEVDVKSVGLPIPFKVKLQRESSREITLLYKSDCIQQGYILQPGSFIVIPAGTIQTEIYFQYNKTTIPPECLISFQISSLSQHNYVIPIKNYYVSAYKSTDKSSLKSLMRMKISKTMEPSTSVGYTILNEQIKPQVYTFENLEMKSNSGLFSISVSEYGKVHFAAIKIGVNRNNILQKDIYQENINSAVYYGSAETAVSTTSISHTANFTITGLQSQTPYLMAAYLNSSVGISDIAFSVAKTSKASNGAAIKMAFTDILDSEKILEALSTVLTVSKDRLSIVQIEETLQNLKDTYDSEIMNVRRFSYQIVLGPDQSNDLQPPIQSFKELATSSALQAKLSQQIPEFISDYRMSYYQIILQKPKFRPGNPVQVVQATFQSIKIKVSMWSESLVSAVALKKQSLPDSPTGIYLLQSDQIINGYTPQNTEIRKEHWHRRILSNGANYTAQLQFTFLEDDHEYVLFITAESLIDYDPKLVVDKDKNQVIEIKTKKNLNVMKTEDQLVQILKEEIGQDWAKDVQQQINNNKQKQKVLGIDKKKRVRKLKT